MVIMKVVGMKEEWQNTDSSNWEMGMGAREFIILFYFWVCLKFP